jgi:hypothetical protein
MAVRKYNEDLSTVFATAEVVDYSYEVYEDGIVFDFLFDEEFECENPF